MTTQPTKKHRDITHQSDSSIWGTPDTAADRYLRAVGISLPDVRDELIRAANERLERTNRSSSLRVREIRLLACVDRVLCERLGAEPSSDMTMLDTVQRRVAFSLNPSLSAQRKLLRARRHQEAAMPQPPERALTPTRLPAVRQRRPMPRQAVEFRRFRNPFRQLAAALRLTGAPTQQES